MQRFFIATFGFGQLGGFGQYYCVYIVAPTELLARVILNKEWGGKWSSIYPQDKAIEIINKYNYKVLGGYNIVTEDHYEYLNPDQIYVK